MTEITIVTYTDKLKYFEDFFNITEVIGVWSHTRTPTKTFLHLGIIHITLISFMLHVINPVKTNIKIFFRLKNLLSETLKFTSIGNSGQLSNNT